MEGHPDNVAPAIYGGLVASYKINEQYKAIVYPVHSKLKFITIIPPTPLSTHEARGVLPKTLGYEDIVHNLSRIIHLPKAFETGNVELLKELFEDRLHEPYRGKLISKYEEIKAICEKENVAFAISGSGSTMIVIAYDDCIRKKLEQFHYEIKVLDVGRGVQIWEG